MPEVNAAVALPAAPDKAWEVLSDFARYDEWLTIHKGWKGELPAAIGAGSSITEVVSIMGMDNKIDWTVDEYDAPQLLRISGTGMAGVKVAFTLGVQPHDVGSNVSIDAEFTGAMIVGAIGNAVVKSTQAELDKSLTNLSGLLG